MKSEYKFSVVMPLYNVEMYLEEAISSIVEQTIGFTDNIQLILINDGSTDDTESICIRYRDEYPDNVVYYKQINQGASAARNTGKQFVRGKYINFFDGDDIWDRDAFQCAWEMFENSGDEIDLVTCRSKYFEQKEGYTALDYKFSNGDFICDINEHPDHVQFSVTTAFVRADAIADLEFDTRLAYGEDAKFVSQLILKKEKYGIISSAEYLIRKRDSNSSLTQTKTENETAYLDTAKLYYQYLVELSLSKYQKVIPYIQYAVINAIKYRVGSPVPESISPEVAKSYIDLLIRLLDYIEPEVICNTAKIAAETRIYLLILKYGDPEAVRDKITIRKNAVYFDGIRVGRILGKKNFRIEAKAGLFNTAVTGSVKMPLLLTPGDLIIEADQTSDVCVLKPSPENTRKSFSNEDMNQVYTFEGKLRGKHDADSITVCVPVNGKKIEIHRQP